MELSHLISIPIVDNVKLYKVTSSNPYLSTDGTLCLTSHHLIFSSRSNKNDELWLLHSLIDSVENRLKEAKPILYLRCKNFKIFQIDFQTLELCQSVYNSLYSLSNIESDDMKYPFFYQLDFTPIEDGWQSFSIDSEFHKLFPHSDAEWRLSTVNKDFKVCSSYAEKVIVPKIIDDALLVKSSEFRMGGRFPVLSYYHKEKKSFLMRCSQPLLGTSNKRCKEDETILNKALPSGKKGLIYDTRDINVAKSAAQKGGGYETDGHYALWKRVNRNLDRYDQLHVSYQKLIEACNDTASDKWMSKLDSSGWLNNVRQALYFACCIANELHNNNSCVLLHGGESLDNTLLISSLVQVVLNPDCRTVTGFQALIEREWIQAGHPFSKRYFKSAFGSTSQRYEGPVFVLFLDCVWQIYEQFRLSFEFNEEFLIELFDNLYSSKFGTFLGNSEKERRLLQLSFRTCSLWSYLNQPNVMKNYINPLYEPNGDPIWPSVLPHSINIWSYLYLRYQIDTAPLSEAKNEMVRLKEKESELKSKVIKMRKDILELQKELLINGQLKPGDNC